MQYNYVCCSSPKLLFLLCLVGYWSVGSYPHYRVRSVLLGAITFTVG